MSKIAAKFTQLKTSIGGNREKNGFEFTFGMPMEEAARITRPNRAINRILSELEFVLQLSAANEGRFDAPLEAALDFLLDRVREQGVITNQDCEKAEEFLAPAEAEAKSYKLILASHAHIDMNWMWSFNETVALTLATFRSILNIMDQYPDFCYSQSQASVYKIVEEYDPDMMEEIKARIKEGRWEVTATAWVETDKNMPSGESLLRHIQYTKEYLTTVWGVERLEVDFSPDTFGHNANVPEINNFGDVKYYYHCRGNYRDEVLYRYQAPSGKEVLVYREPYWYNSAITPHIASGLLEVSKRSCGLKTGLIVYGVGDHGGGPTRRDVERAQEMMTWKIYPQIKFGTLHEYFHEAEKIREQLPVVKEELNSIFPGCYTTQSRIKRGNRHLEVSLQDAEAMTSIAGNMTGFSYARPKMVKAWQDVLFTHFHDILTGSCVQDTREHAMGLYQTSTATANTQIQNAMRRIALNIDTSSILVDIDAYNSQSEGAGVGFGLENFVGVPSTERGSGRTRIFHVFNTLSWERQQIIELTVWDWTGDLRRLYMTDAVGNEIPFQLLDRSFQHYWDHKYIRVLAEVTVPALGYTTIVLKEREPENYPVYLQDAPQVASPFDDYVLENARIKVCISAHSGRLVSVIDKTTGEELIASGESAGLTFIETEKQTSDAWNIGRHIKDIPIDRCTSLQCVTNGSLRQSVKATLVIQDSSIDVTYTLDKFDSAVKIAIKADWREHGVDQKTIPVLDYRIPLAYSTQDYQYDIPIGSIRRKERNLDVPALQYGMALRKDSQSNAILISDSKYGYRGTNNHLALTLINSSIGPDPYPERGIHNITLWLGACTDQALEAEKLATSCNHALFYQPSNCHTGTLPMENGLLTAVSESAFVSAVLPSADGSLIVRVYETAGKSAPVTLTFASEVKSAKAINLLENEVDAPVAVNKNQVTFTADAFALAAVKITL